MNALRKSYQCEIPRILVWCLVPKNHSGNGSSDAPTGRGPVGRQGIES